MLRLFLMAGAVLCFTALAIAYFYMERYLLLEPCPLCILDRLVVVVMGGIFLLSLFVGARGRWLLWGINILTLGLGFVFAGRHVWQQYQSFNETVNCLSDSAISNSVTEIISRAFGAKGDCGAIYWEFWGLSIPEQLLVLFTVFAILLAAQWREMRR